MPRKGSKSLSLMQRIYSPLGKLLNATGNSAGIVTNSVGAVTKRGIKTFSNVGSRYAKAANNGIRSLTSRRARRSNRSTRRKTRRNTRR